MAIAPDDITTFTREVDENLRRDQVRDAARTYGKWAIIGVILLLAAIGGFLFWRDQQAKQAATDSEAMAATIDNIGSGNLTPVPGQLDTLEQSGSEAIGVSAKLTRAAVALQSNDRPKAIAIYKQVAADDGVDQPWRDLATIRQTALEYDELQPQVVIERLAPMTMPGSPWFGSAGEMTALALLKAGRKSEAGRLFAAVASDRGVPDSIRERAMQIATTLGVDASAALNPVTTAPAP